MEKADRAMTSTDVTKELDPVFNQDEIPLKTIHLNVS